VGIENFELRTTKENKRLKDQKSKTPSRSPPTEVATRQKQNKTKRLEENETRP
jgi:hypothetical protein